MATGPCMNYRAEAGKKNKPDMFFVQAHKKGLKIGPQSRLAPLPKISSIYVWRDSGPLIDFGWKTSIMFSPNELVRSFFYPLDSVFHLKFHPRTEGRELNIWSSKFLTIITRACLRAANTER